MNMRYVTINDIIAYNGFGFIEGRETLTERVLAHSTTLSSSSPCFLYGK